MTDRRFIQMLGTVVCAVSLLTGGAGCRTWQKSQTAAVHQFAAGELTASRESLNAARESRRSEAGLLELDSAILQLADGNAAEAETQLRHVRRELELLEQKDVREQTTSILTDDNAVAYAGRDFERHMILNMLTISSMLNGGQDAFAYSQQATEKASEIRQQLTDAARTRNSTGANSSVQTASFSDVHNADSTPSQPVVIAAGQDEPLALAMYLSAIIQSEQPTRYSAAERAINDLQIWNRDFAHSLQKGSNADFGAQSQAGHGTLHVIAFVGQAPEWVTESAEPTSAALLVADRIISATGKHTLPPTVSAVKIGRPVPSAGTLPVAALNCTIAPSADGTAGSTTAVEPEFHTLVDLQATAAASYHEHRDKEIGRAIARRVIKKGAVYVAKEVQNVARNSLVDLAINVAGIAWEATEKPDTRAWRMLPARVDVARSELPVGVWNAQIRIGGGKHSHSTVTVPVHIDSGRNTIVVCFIPQDRLTGHALIGGADRGVIPIP